MLIPQKIFFSIVIAFAVCMFSVNTGCGIYRFNDVSIPDSIKTKFRQMLKKEAAGICLAGVIITFLIMIAFSGVLFDI